MCERLLEIDEPKSLKIFFSPKTWAFSEERWSYFAPGGTRHSGASFSDNHSPDCVTSMTSPANVRLQRKKPFIWEKGKEQDMPLVVLLLAQSLFLPCLWHILQQLQDFKNRYKKGIATNQRNVTFQEISNARKLVVGRASFFLFILYWK